MLSTGTSIMYGNSRFYGSQVHLQMEFCSGSYEQGKNGAEGKRGSPHKREKSKPEFRFELPPKPLLVTSG